MSTGTSAKTRSGRVASIVLPARGFLGFLQQIRGPKALVGLALCLLATTVFWAVTYGWATPFSFRSGYIPSRDLTARIEFRVASRELTEHVYRPGDVLALASRPLDRDELQVLYAEHTAALAHQTLWSKLYRSAARFGFVLLVCILVAVYLRMRRPQVLKDRRLLALVLAMAVIAAAVCMVVSTDSWRAETVPLAIFGMSAALVYRRETALVLSMSLALVVTIGLGFSLAEFLIAVTSTAAPLLMLGRIRSRTHLICVGLCGGCIAFGVAVCMGAMFHQTYGVAHATQLSTVDGGELFSDWTFGARLLAGGIWHGACVLLAGFLMTGLLPFLERLLRFQTDISMLELGDPAHPLLQELARRAPGTYNHSINVASIAQPAAEVIGANGLMVRVGAYFHDIGKMLNPEYFIENMAGTSNQHDALVPTMSTLVIIAHVKDGADLARKHRLPKSIIDFIEQHHGTTLVEYFFRQAEQQQNPADGELDESRFRYPGPKPQTRESAVLMLADAAESAARSLIDPTPSRLESLVHELAQKRLLDGQFDDCRLTFQELSRVEDCLTKSLIAVYHGRIKYPNQQTA